MKPKATIQVDLDGLWTLYQYHGLTCHPWPDPVYTQALPRFLDTFLDFGVPATFFVIGKDAQCPEKQSGIKEIIKYGHEVANHSFSHEIPYFQKPMEEIKKDIQQAEKILKEVTGVTPKGFRAPGYGINPAILEFLQAEGYQYDASIFPSPWAKALARIEKKKCQPAPPDGGFGSGKYGWSSVRPYTLKLSGSKNDRLNSLREIPVSVYPFLRTPMHRSITQFLGDAYWMSGISLSHALGRPFSLLFHGVDLVDGLYDAKLPELKRITTPFPQRIDEIRKMVKYLKRKYIIVPTCEI